jgi:hypothetical protein
MTNWNDIEQEQKAVCKRLGIPWTPVDNGLMIAISESMFTDTKPINGLRHPRQESIDGWYIWSGGEIPQGNDIFFNPIHPEHLLEKQPLVLKYLGLPYGYRFQIDDKGYEDVWFDQSILEIE